MKMLFDLIGLDKKQLNTANKASKTGVMVNVHAYANTVMWWESFDCGLHLERHQSYRHEIKWRSQPVHIFFFFIESSNSRKYKTISIYTHVLWENICCDSNKVTTWYMACTHVSWLWTVHIIYIVFTVIKCFRISHIFFYTKFHSFNFRVSVVILSSNQITYYPLS